MHLTINIGGCVDERRRGRGTGRTMIERAHEALCDAKRAGAIASDLERRARDRVVCDTPRRECTRRSPAPAHADELPRRGECPSALSSNDADPPCLALRWANHDVDVSAKTRQHAEETLGRESAQLTRYDE